MAETISPLNVYSREIVFSEKNWAVIVKASGRDFDISARNSITRIANTFHSDMCCDRFSMRRNHVEKALRTLQKASDSLAAALGAYDIIKQLSSLDPTDTAEAEKIYSLMEKASSSDSHEDHSEYLFQMAKHLYEKKNKSSNDYFVAFIAQFIERSNADGTHSFGPSPGAIPYFSETLQEFSACLQEEIERIGSYSDKGRTADRHIGEFCSKLRDIHAKAAGEQDLLSEKCEKFVRAVYEEIKVEINRDTPAVDLDKDLPYLTGRSIRHRIEAYQNRHVTPIND